MIPRLRTHQLISPDMIEPTQPELRVVGAFNPGAIRYKDEVILLIRVAETAQETRQGYFSSPYFTQQGSKPHILLEWLQPDQASKDHRKPLLPNGMRRLSFISHLEIVRIDQGGFHVKSIEKHPQLMGLEAWENYGIEDPRIIELNGTYYITYVAVSSSMGICTALMSTNDFQTFTRHGIIFPTDNKDVVIGHDGRLDRYYAYHRPVGKVPLTKPAIWFADSEDLTHWGNYKIVFGPAKEPKWDSGKIGLGTPPIRIDEGMLAVYHGVQYNSQEDEIGRYAAGAILFDRHKPDQVTARSTEPFMTAQESFETKGFVDNVVFPTGIIKGDNTTVTIYYGAADMSVGAASFSIADILTTLGNHV